MLLSLLAIVVGFGLLVGGANLLVDGACRLAARFGMPERVAGLTVVAIGTSLPELVVSITSAAAGHADMAFGNVVGSCLANLLLILGLSAVIAPVALSRGTIRFEIPVGVAACALLALLANTGGEVTQLEGVVLLAAFAAFLVRTTQMGLKEGADEKDAGSREGAGEQAAGGRRPSVAWALWLVVVGAVMLKVGADLVVDNATLVATAAGISERVIGITVVALGTCLPELVTSVVAALRGNSDIAVGNVTGSNIANLLLVMGGPALFSSIPYDAAYNLDLALVAVFSLALVGFCYVGRHHEMSRVNGVIFVVLYAAYIAASVLR
ncbi:calcium/sodium antiporter [Thermophilibacter provencensis]|uniref:Calcium/sodium antiporter n=1 Tax=Thermophilibacter provencensis TaxID=1852386 RepID=A0ABT7V171_9ACTN|nr:calcium/sodium antiporter [Thermophilibacter provencensis]MDM8270221.1 calcium/sodium antiporter [Thermophilibacter provencensis]